MVLKLSAILVAVTLSLGSLSVAQAKAGDEALLGSPKSGASLRPLDQVWELAIDQVEQEQAIAILRKAVKLNPNLSVAHEILAQTSFDPAERVSEQRKAFATQTHATPAERTIVNWFQHAADHKLILAITDMNEVLQQYPHERWVVYLAVRWLTSQTQYERAAAIYENSAMSDFPGLLNNAAYTYAAMRKFDRAFALMEKYSAALPNNANPQDSYAEMLHMAGRFDEAIEHYKAALILNPEFYSSQLGIADTYSLAGDQLRARREYEAAFRKFSLPPLDRILWKTREATTYVRDEDFKNADRAFQEIATYAHARRMGQVEAETYRQMALYQIHPERSFVFLSKAENALREGNNMMKAEVQQELAQILRARVELAVRTHRAGMADVTLAKLSRLSDKSDDKLIETAYHGAAGAVLFSRHAYKQAVLHLEEDVNNPFSLELLALAYREVGDTNDANSTDETLASMNDPTLEQALIVPAFRKCLQNPSCTGKIKNASFHN